jgi:hypothetical protein
MRVCQFRHYGTVFYTPHRGPEHANRELLVLQTGRRLSIREDACRRLSRGRLRHETSTQKRRLLVQEGNISLQ